MSKKTLKAGTDIVFVKDCNIGHYVVGDKAIILSVCNAGEISEHYEIKLSCGKRSWADKSDFKVKKQKPWKKATEKRIAKLEVGDIVLLRNGSEAKIIETWNGGTYPVCHNVGVNSYMGCHADGKACIGEDEYDIVKVKNKKYKEEE